MDMSFEGEIKKISNIYEFGIETVRFDVRFKTGEIYLSKVAEFKELQYLKSNIGSGDFVRCGLDESQQIISMIVIKRQAGLEEYGS